MVEEQSQSNLEGTSLGSSQVSNGESELDALIKETLAESKVGQNQQKEEAKIPLSTPEPKSETKPEATAPTPTVPEIKTPAEAPKSSAAAPTQNYGNTFKDYKKGDVIEGTVVKVDQTGILVDVGYKSEGFVPTAELSEKPFNSIDEIVKLGDKITVYIEKLENSDGYLVLSKKRAEYENQWKIAYDAFKKKKVLEATVTSAVKGGLVVDFGGIRGFIPASQVVRKSDESLESLVKKTLPIKILEIDRRQGKVVLSHKLAATSGGGQTDNRSAQRDKLIAELEVGQVRKGKVASIKKFGAFVDLGGLEGLIHLSELSWKRVRNPEEVLKIADEIDVFVLGVDKNTKKVALGLKQLQPDPWVSADEHFKVGDIVKVKVARFTKFGAFVELGYDLEGLIHISEISTKPIQRSDEVLTIGQEVDAKIIKIIPEEQKIGLSIKAITEEADKKSYQEYKAAEVEQKTEVTIGDLVKEKEILLQAQQPEEEVVEEIVEENVETTTDETPK